MLFFHTVFDDSQEYGAAARELDDDESQLAYGRVAERMEYERGGRALMRAFRQKLHETGKYAGSKVEIMDIFHIKLTELSSWPLVLTPCGVFEESGQPKVRRRQKKAKNNNTSDFRPPRAATKQIEKRIMPLRGARKRVNSDD
ncbi:hypothetical protein KC906_02350 [Candidatus Kaiserbacteria bacterium]|nr:hypothetical protein [Candidatus Kaiserbacteria bacterium]